jgi:SAM-dependent methyltransferase
MTASVASELVAELRSSSSLIDRATAQACRRVIASHETAWSAWEIEQTLAELGGLVRNRDCTYDRPSVGVSYALWYQGKRTHDALRMLAPRIARATGSLRIVDLGCGTGATACAVALAVAALERSGSSAVDRVTVDGIDSSPFMVEVAREVFAALVSATGCSRVRATFESRPWDSVDVVEGAPTAIVGGYLLDHSDGAHADEIAQRLKVLADKLSASSIVLSTAAGKGPQLGQVQTALEGDEWQPAGGDGEPWPALVGGPLGRCHAVRTSWYTRHRLTAESLWRSPPSWSSDRLAARLTLSRRPGRIAATLFDDARDGRLYDASQERAARPEGRLTVIVGAAGSGKTIVLSERIARTIVAAPRSEPPPVVLVTAFNKSVVDLIATEVVRSLELAEGVAVKHERHGDGRHGLDVAVGGRTARVELMNRDRLPGRVFGVGQIKGELKGGWWKRELECRIAKLDAADRALVAKLGHDFLEDEFERVIYGLGCFELAQYADVDRIGRVTPLAKGSAREVVWRLLMEPPIESHVHQRVKAYRRHESAVTQARAAELDRRWTHVFVDECQDFTRSDIRLLARVPSDPRRLCMAGDASQAIHLGRSYHRPGIAGAQWKTHLLDGSYRLPLRVCEALQPLARDIRSSHLASRLEDDLDTVLLRSRKAAVAGFRPIVLAGDHAAGQLGDVLRAYASPTAPQRLLAANCGRRTSAACARAACDRAWTVDEGDMRKYKGLEWPCVVVTNERRGSWRDTSEAASERLFTAMTRTTALLVIVLWEDGDADTTALLGRLDADRMLFWDAAASTSFDRARRAGASDAPVRGRKPARPAAGSARP